MVVFDVRRIVAVFGIMGLLSGVCRAAEPGTAVGEKQVGSWIVCMRSGRIRNLQVALSGVANKDSKLVYVIEQKKQSKQKKRDELPHESRCLRTISSSRLVEEQASAQLGKVDVAEATRHIAASQLELTDKDEVYYTPCSRKAYLVFKKFLLEASKNSDGPVEDASNLISEVPYETLVEDAVQLLPRGRGGLFSSFWLKDLQNPTPKSVLQGNSLEILERALEPIRGLKKLQDQIKDLKEAQDQTQ